MASAIGIPDEKVNFVPIHTGETFKLGPMTCRVMEDGSKTGGNFPILCIEHISNIIQITA